MGNKLSSSKSNIDDKKMLLQLLETGGFKIDFFGCDLKEMMYLTNLYYPELKVPWPLFVLTQQILELKGLETEGIFRMEAKFTDIDLYVNELNSRKIPDVKNVHIPANVLKKLLRELHKPIIPSEFYEICLSAGSIDKRIKDKVLNRLPKDNRIVLLFLIDFLRKFTDPLVVEVTKMTVYNLAVVFAPNCFRYAHSSDLKLTNDNIQGEILFFNKLIQSKNIKFPNKYRSHKLS